LILRREFESLLGYHHFSLKYIYTASKRMMIAETEKARQRQGMRTDLDSELSGQLAGMSGDARDIVAEGSPIVPELYRKV